MKISSGYSVLNFKFMLQIFRRCTKAKIININSNKHKQIQNIDNPKYKRFRYNYRNMESTEDFPIPSTQTLTIENRKLLICNNI